MEDFIQLIFFVVIILLGLISSAKKKVPPKTRADGATPAAGAAPSGPRARELQSTEAEELAQPGAAGQVEEEGRPKRGLAEELLAFLEGNVEPPQEPVAVPPVVEEEAVSVETLEPAGEESHARFREKYVDAVPQKSPYSKQAPARRPYAVKDVAAERPYLVDETETPPPYAIHDSSKQKRKLTRSELRHAFVMKEVLGPPKALE